jgi:hypothetical protein
MKGYSFHFENFDFPKLKQLIEYFGINSLFRLTSSKITFPQTLDESLQFISQSFCEYLEEQYHQSLSIIVQNISKLSFEDLSKLSNSHLFKIFSSESLEIENEDYLFKIIAKMIQRDKNRMILLKTVHLEFVSSHLVKKFFDNIPNDEIDYETFESLKRRLFSDYSDQDQLSKRWKTKPKILSQTETNEIFDILNSYFEDGNKPNEQIKLLIDQIKQLK